MKVGIIGAMQEEIDILVNQMTTVTTKDIAGANFYSGKLKDISVVVVRSGIGKVLAGMTATILAESFAVDYIINSGSAGGIGDVRIGDVVIAERTVYFDVDVTAFGYEFGQVPKMPLYYEAGIALLAAAKKNATTSDNTHHFGLIATGDMFIDKKEVIKKLTIAFPEILCNDMEGAAIAQVALQYQIPSLVVRSISDSADEEADEVFAKNIKNAGATSAAYVVELVTNLHEIVNA